MILRARFTGGPGMWMILPGIVMYSRHYGSTYWWDYPTNVMSVNSALANRSHRPRGKARTLFLKLPEIFG